MNRSVLIAFLIAVCAVPEVSKTAKAYSFQAVYLKIWVFVMLGRLMVMTSRR